MFDTQDLKWMSEAIRMAQRAECEGEVPVGAVLVKDGVIIGNGWNRNIASNDPSQHAEISALQEAGKALENYRLPGCTLYVTLEPCIMCAGAMIHARIERLVFGATDPKTGAAGGCFDLLEDSRHNHRVKVDGNCLGPECSTMLKSFFKKRRESADMENKGTKGESS